MDAISYEYTKQRKQFGLHPVFGDSQSINQSIDQEPDDLPINQAADDSTNQFTPLSPLIENIPPPKSSAQWLESISQSINLDCIPTRSMHSINTEPFIQHSKAINHTDGAWPTDIKTNEFIDRQRYVRRLINEPSYTQSVPVLTKQAESIIAVNNTIDAYQTYFSNTQTSEDDEFHSKPPSLRTVCVFRDPVNQSNNQTNNQSMNLVRSATKISWHPEAPTKLAVSYSVTSFAAHNQSNNQSNQSINQSINQAYIWDLNTPNHPDAILNPPSSLSCIAYNPRSPDHLIGGCWNGQLCFFDLRKGGIPQETSMIEKSHGDPVYDVYWIQSRTGNEIVSLSTDGQLLWWDVRKLKKGFMDSMTLNDPSTQLVYGGCSMEYKSDAGATRFLIGTEQGVCMLADRKAKKDAESTKSIKAIYGTITQSQSQTESSIDQPINASLPCNGAHYGPVTSIQRCPFNVKIFLTCGDWCAKIWMEDLKEPIFVSRSMNRSIDQSQQPPLQPSPQTNTSNAQVKSPSPTQSSVQSSANPYVTCAAWSPTRPGVFFLAKSDGSLDVYDLMRKCEVPVLTQQICSEEITSLKVSPSGKYVACGSSHGSVTLLQCSRSLIEPANNEKTSITNLFERETKREKALEVKKAQARKTAPAVNPSQKPIEPLSEVESPETKEALARAEEEFWVMIDQSKGEQEESKESHPDTTQEEKEQSQQQEEEKTNE